MFKISLLFIVAIMLSSCAGSYYIDKYTDDPLQGVNKVYIIKADSSYYEKFMMGIVLPSGYIPLVVDGEVVKTKAIGDTDKYLKKEFDKLGMKTSIGYYNEIPDDTDLLVIYSDKWRWDFKKIMDRLDVEFIDYRSKELVAEMKYRIGSKDMHDYPSAQEEVPRLFNKYLNE